jgi:hypothetical protein
VGTRSAHRKTHARDTRAEILRAARHELSPLRARDIAQLLGTISEGTNPIYATAARSARSLARVAQLAGELLMHAAGTGGAQPRASGKPKRKKPKGRR